MMMLCPAHLIYGIAIFLLPSRISNNSQSNDLLVSGLALPESQKINRRKSPALWRTDLSDLAVDGGSKKNGREQKRRPLIQRPPEVMAPVGGWPQLHAAIGNGADSIYLGLSAFSARARAANFDPVTELPKAVRIAHEADVKVYVALNTLVFDHELVEVEELIRQCSQAKVDALIVQDLGVARLASLVAPSLEVHASTQQTITSADGAEFCQDVFGTSRVVLGRELSTAEIDLVSDRLTDTSLEIEAFVHGALCVSYSGQCFSSEAWGGRSANRGQCAQACRLPYGLIDNGELKELGDFSYLLSPQDLCGIDQVPKLLESNVSCLKIEGRLKDEFYVAATTRAYRNAVDEAWTKYSQEHDVSSSGMWKKRMMEQEEVSRNELAQLFSRGQDESHNGLSAGFFDGSRHQDLVRGRSPRHRGIHIGRVKEGSDSKRGLLIQTNTPGMLKLGDGIVVDRGLAQKEELGGSIFDIREESGGTVLHLSRDTERRWKEHDVAVRNGHETDLLAPAGAHVWKTSDATVDKKMKRLSNAQTPKSVVGVKVSGTAGEPLRIQIRDAQGREGTGQSDGALVLAEKTGLSEKSIKKAIGTLGNTPWAIESDIDLLELDGGVWCPMSWLKEARRIAVADLLSTQQQVQSSTGTTDSISTKLQYDVASRLLMEIQEEEARHAPTKGTSVSVLARDMEQVDTLCSLVDRGSSIAEIIVDFLEVDGMKEAVTRIRQSGVKTVVASPRIIKPGESGIWRTLLRLQPDGLLVRSNGLLHRMMKLGGPGRTAVVDLGDGEQEVVIPELIGDFSLNVANALTAWELLEYGCSRVTSALDLNANSITELLEAAGPANAGRVDIIAHTHLPIFHTEHCVFARFLSKGNSYMDCGHVCTRHNVHLRDQGGSDNLVLADMGCRNTVFSSQAQSGAYSVKEWMGAGAGMLRLELVDESSIDVEYIVKGYLDLMNGSIRPKELWEVLDGVCDSNGRRGGVGHGSLRNGVERRAGEIQV